MAKTRIKTTPTRMQKEALIASAAVTTTTNVNINTEHVLKKRLTAFNHTMLNKEAIASSQSAIIVQPPKRTNSISSITSTISHTSDGCSSVESSPPLRMPTAPAGITISRTSTPTNSSGPTMAELTENAIKTLNAGLLAKSTALALKNRKVYMITEKCDDSYSGSNVNNNGGGNNGRSTGSSVTGNGQKRKMYLIMEEKETDIAEKFMKSESSSSGAKKLTLFTDTANGQLPQKIEKILPEILNCIQAKGSGGITATGTGNNNATTTNTNRTADCPKNSQTVSQSINSRSLLKLNANSNVENNDRLPLTLPPKKNRTKIITTQIIPVISSTCPVTTPVSNTAPHGKNVEGCHLERGVTTVYCSNGNGNRNGNNNAVDTHSKTEKSSATPVIVNANTLLANGSNNGAIKLNGCTLPSLGSAPQMHKNINLSADFLFLMKMLPKLESISETHKNYVKSSIEDLINQYSTIDPAEDQ